jgi:hypothetical protein
MAVTCACVCVCGRFAARREEASCPQAGCLRQSVIGKCFACPKKTNTLSFRSNPKSEQRPTGEQRKTCQRLHLFLFLRGQFPQCVPHKCLQERTRKRIVQVSNFFRLGRGTTKVRYTLDFLITENLRGGPSEIREMQRNVPRGDGLVPAR